jgi:hypothetical protein
VTFSLPGFSTVKRDGIELSGAFVAVINVELKVGTLQETIVVHRRNAHRGRPGHRSPDDDGQTS